MKTEPYSSIVFLHLSDIHFSKGRERYDPDSDLRNELEKDALRFSKDIGGVAAILVTGDIAFSGKTEEYNQASNWLKQLSVSFGLDYGRDIWVVPGNHDVDREAYKRNSPLTPYLEKSVAGDMDNLNEQLRQIFNDERISPFIYESISNYNKFAQAFGCDLDIDRKYWQADYPLENDVKLRLRGLNSTLNSSEADKKSKNLFLGLNQVELIREKRTVNFTLCHHPPDWLFDSEAIETYLNSRADVQLFGHIHKNVFNTVNGKIILKAGAVHPERKEKGWGPRYNFIRVSAHENNIVSIEIYPRVWHERHTEFIPDWNETKGFISHQRFYQVEEEKLVQIPAPKTLGKLVQIPVPKTLEKRTEVTKIRDLQGVVELSDDLEAVNFTYKYKLEEFSDKTFTFYIPYIQPRELNILSIKCNDTIRPKTEIKRFSDGVLLSLSNFTGKTSRLLNKLEFSINYPSRIFLERISQNDQTVEIATYSTIIFHTMYTEEMRLTMKLPKDSIILSQNVYGSANAHRNTIEFTVTNVPENEPKLFQVFFKRVV